MSPGVVEESISLAMEAIRLNEVMIDIFYKRGVITQKDIHKMVMTMDPLAHEHTISIK